MIATGKRMAVAAAALAASLSVPAIAADAGLYVLGSLGATNLSSTDPDSTGATSEKKSSTGVKVGGGYLFDLGKAKLGVEAAYVDLGKATFTFPGGDVTLKTNGVLVAGVGVLPINDQWSVLAKLGVYNSTVKTDGGGVSNSSKGNLPMWGIGGQYDLNRHIGFRAEYEAYQGGKKGDANDPNNNDVLTKINMFSAGIVYKFGN
jgi:OOP family OmpA-OmpF porin